MGEQENILIGQKYFWTYENVFLSPSKNKIKVVSFCRKSRHRTRLKVSKSQKQFLLKLHSLKTERNIRQNSALHMKLGQNFVKYFVRSLGNRVSRKNAFEIY